MGRRPWIMGLPFRAPMYLAKYTTHMAIVVMLICKSLTLEMLDDFCPLVSEF